MSRSTSPTPAERQTLLVGQLQLTASDKHFHLFVDEQELPFEAFADIAKYVDEQGISPVIIKETVINYYSRP